MALAGAVLLTATPAKPETDLEAAIRAKLSETGAWKALYESQTGKPAPATAKLKSVAFKGTAVALPMEFELPKGSAPKPTVLQETRLLNCSTLAQTGTFAVSKATTQTTTVTWNKSTELGVTLNWSAGLPYVGGSGGSATARQTKSFGGSETEATTLTWNVSVPTALAPQTLQTVQFVVEELREVDVPFTMDVLYRGKVELKVAEQSGPQRFVLKGAASNKCLDISRSDTVGKSRQVIIWDCHGGPNQRWHWDSKGRLKSDENLCLDISRGSRKDGAKLIGYRCHGNWNQKFRASGKALKANHGLCVDVSKGSTKNGAGVIVYPCHGKANQQWRAENRGGPAASTRAISGLIEDVLPDTSDRIMQISGTMDVETGLNGSVRWGATEEVGAAYCLGEDYNNEPTVAMPIAQESATKLRAVRKTE